MTRLSSILFLLFSFFSILSAEDLHIVQTTDMHGESGIFSNKPGLIRIGTAIKEVRQKAGAGNLLLVDCGDVLQGSFAASFDKGATMIEAMNQLQYDVWVLGNHDFDFGTELLKKRIREFKGTVLAANIKWLNEKEKLTGKWALFERGGHRIAVIGCAPPYLRHWIAPAQLTGIQEQTVEDAVSAVMPEVRQARPDLIILAVHVGRFTSQRLAKSEIQRSLAGVTKKYPEIRIILGGHTHETVPLEKVRSETVYVQAPPIGTGAAEITVHFEQNGMPSVTSNILFGEKYEEDPDLQVIFAPLNEKLKNFNRTIADVPVELKPQNGREPSALADLLADSMRAETTAEIAFSSTLSNYAMKPDQSVNELNLFLLTPYENFITILTLTKQDLQAILDEQNALPEKFLYLHVSGLEVRDGKFFLNGKEWANNRKTVTAAFGSYAASGAGGRYPVLKEIAGRANRQELTLTVRDVFREYLKKHFPPKGQKN